MKRILIVVAVLMLLPSLTSRAQEYKYEAKLGWIPGDLLDLVYLMGEDPSGETSYGPMKTVGIFTADFDYKVKNWVSVGTKLSYRNSWRDMRTVIDGDEVNGTDRIQAVSVMPTLKLTTGYDSIFRCYATLGLGLALDFSDGFNGGFVAPQFTPIGISIGKKISWYCECGIGYAFTGFMTGLSWRF